MLAIDEFEKFWMIRAPSMLFSTPNGFSDSSCVDKIDRHILDQQTPLASFGKLDIQRIDVKPRRFSINMIISSFFIIVRSYS